MKQLPVVTKEMADRIAHMVNNKFNELTNNQQSPFARRKVLAGIVSTRNNDPGTAQV